MIASLSGKLKHRECRAGHHRNRRRRLQVFDSACDLLSLPGLGAPVALEIRQVVREDSLSSMVSPAPRSRSSIS